MARADCSDWALKINDAATNIASLGKGLDLEAIAKEISAGAGIEISRETVIQSINEATATGDRDLTEGQKNIAAIKKEAQLDPQLLEETEQLERNIAEGAEPVTQAKAETVVSDIISGYRRSIKRLKGIIAKKRSSDKEEARLKLHKEELRHELETGEKAPKRKPIPREVSDAVLAERAEIKELQAQLAEKRKEATREEKPVKSQEETIAELVERIAEKEKIIDAGLALEKREITVEDISDRERDLRETDKDLGRILAKRTTEAEAEEQTVARLEEGIKTLSAKLRNSRISTSERKAALEEKSTQVQLLEETRASLQGKRAELKRIAAVIQGIVERIAENEQILQAGKVPKKKLTRKNQKALEKELRKTEAAIKKAVSQSEPVKIDRIETTIARLEAIIKKGDFAPKIQPEPTPQSDKLDRVEFERDKLQRQIRAKTNELRPKKPLDRVVSVLGLLRTVMTAGEASFVARQGAFFSAGRPIMTAKQLPGTFRAAASERAAFRIREALDKRPMAIWYRRSKLFLAELDGNLSAMEEDIQTKWATRIPIIAQSSRAYVTFLNGLRADAFDTLAASVAPNRDLTIREAQIIANFVNAATGRGNLPGGLQNAATIMNLTFFAARFQTSRFQLLFGLPATAFGRKETAQVRKAVAFEYARALAGVAVFYSLMSLALGAGDDEEDEEGRREKSFDIEWDTRSSDFGKIRMGNTRIDPLAGLSQTVVLLSRVGHAFMRREAFKSPKTQNIRKLSGVLRFGQSDASDTIASFLRNRFSPALGLFVNVLDDRNFIGDDVTTGSTLRNLLIPITYNDIYDVYREQDVPRATALSMLAFFGVGIQNWGEALELKTNNELRAELERFVFREDKLVKRKDPETGEKVEVGVRFGEPHQGQDGRVAAIQAELRRRGVSIFPSRKTKAPKSTGFGGF